MVNVKSLGWSRMSARRPVSESSPSLTGSLKVILKGKLAGMGLPRLEETDRTAVGPVWSTVNDRDCSALPSSTAFAGKVTVSGPS